MSEVAVGQAVVEQPLAMIGEKDHAPLAAARCQPGDDFPQIVIGEVHAIVVLIDQAHLPFGKRPRRAHTLSKMFKTGGVSILVAEVTAFHVQKNDRLRVFGQVRQYLVQPHHEIGIESAVPLLRPHVPGEGDMVCLEGNLRYGI